VKLGSPIHHGIGSVRSCLALIASLAVGTTEVARAGNVVVWGGFAQLRSVPPEATNVVRLDIGSRSGGEQALALRADGSLVAWGMAGPPAQGTLSNLVEVLVGTSIYAGIGIDGAPQIWPRTGSLAAIPAAATNLVKLQTGGNYLAGLRQDGKTLFWGSAPNYVTNVPARATDLVRLSIFDNQAGATFVPGYVVGLRPDGMPVAWGQGGAVTNPPALVPEGNAVDAVRGAAFGLALLGDGTVRAWGDPAYGLTNPPATATNIVAIAAGATHAIALRNDGTVISWGGGSYSQTNVPAGLSNVVSIAAGVVSGAAVLGDGSPRFVDQMGRMHPPHGAKFVLNAFAVGEHPLDYTWFKDGDRLEPEKSPHLLLPSVSPADKGTYTVVVSNRWGTATSEVARLSIEVPVQLTSQPEDRMALVGDPVVLSVTATGTPPPSYQWFRNRTNAVGSGGPVLDFSAVQMADGGDYHVVVANYNGAVTSRVAKVAVRPSANFNVWTFGYTNQPSPPILLLAIADIPSAATNIVRLSLGMDHVLAQRADGSLVSWGRGALTNVPAGLPRLRTFRAGGPVDVGIAEDGSVIAWSALARSETNIPPGAAFASDIALAAWGKITVVRPDGQSVSWSPLGLDQRPVVAEATGLSRVSLAVDAVGNDDSGLRRDGRVVVWNGPDPVVLSHPPSSGTNVVAICSYFGGRAFLDGAGGVSSSPDNPLVPKPDGVSNIVSIAAAGAHVLALRNDGRIFAWGKARTGLSTETELTNIPPHLSTNVIAMATSFQVNVVAVGDGTPLFVDEMGSVVARLGDDFYLNAFAVAQPPITYRWSKDGVPVPQGDAPTLKLAAVTAQTAGSYSVVVSKALGSITGVVATVTVETPASILVDPADRSVRAGYRTTFSAAAAGDPAPSVQWQFEGTNIAGANASMHSIPLIRPEDAGGYRVVVSNFTGFATSQVATLTVLPGIAFQVPNPGGGLGPDGFRFRITGLEPTGRVILYGSTNLVDWQPLQTNAPASGFLDLLDAGATNRPARFYKVEETGAE
jgi:alpha-tubulin suppressor-like RCC1 family protein